jgi:hypothetical protein
LILFVHHVFPMLHHFYPFFSVSPWLFHVFSSLFRTPWALTSPFATARWSPLCLTPGAAWATNESIHGPRYKPPVGCSGQYAYSINRYIIYIYYWLVVWNIFYFP